MSTPRRDRVTLEASPRSQMKHDPTRPGQEIERYEWYHVDPVQTCTARARHGGSVHRGGPGPIPR